MEQSARRSIPRPFFHGRFVIVPDWDEGRWRSSKIALGDRSGRAPIGRPSFRFWTGRVCMLWVGRRHVSTRL